MGYRPIESYGVIGDLHTVALVAADGTTGVWETQAVQMSVVSFTTTVVTELTCIVTSILSV